MKQMKKVLSLLLCFAMLCSMALFLAPQASADGSSEHWVAAWHGSVLNAAEDSQAAKAALSARCLDLPDAEHSVFRFRRSSAARISA